MFIQKLNQKIETHDLDLPQMQFRSTYQEFDQQNNRLVRTNLDEMQMQFRCNLDKLIKSWTLDMLDLQIDRSETDIQIHFKCTYETIYMQFVCNIDTIQKQSGSNSDEIHI